jgi:hypothetical protein
MVPVRCCFMRSLKRNSALLPYGWRAVWSRISRAMWAGMPGEKKPCPIPGTFSKRAPGMSAATAAPFASGSRGSAVPWMTRVGAVMRDSGACRS